MSKETVITLRQVCECYDIDPLIVRDFADFGLYPLNVVDGEFSIEVRYLERVEHIFSLHRSLGVNKEGIDIILELRAEITRLQEEMEKKLNEVSELKAFLRAEDPELLRNLGRLIEIDD